MRRRRRNPEIAGLDVQQLLIAGAVAAGIYVVYKLVQGLGAAGSAVYKGAQAATAPVAGGIASIWTKLTSGPNMGGVPGDVVLPDGTDMGPLSSMQIKQDPSGNVYVQSGGAVYQLGQSDSNGNWPATIVLDTDFGVTGGSW